MTERNEINENMLDLDISNISHNNSMIFEPKESLNSPRISQEIEITEIQEIQEENEQEQEQQEQQNIPIQSPNKNKPLSKREAEIAK